MPTELKLRGGTTAESDAFTGAAREITIDTETPNLRVHDGSTAGGTPIGGGGGLTGINSAYAADYLLFPHNIVQLDADHVLTPDKIFTHPALFFWEQTITELGVFVATPDAASTDTRVGIWEVDVNGKLGTLLYGSDALDVSAAGRVTVTLPTPLNLSGQYWFGVRTDSATLTIYDSSINNSQIFGSIGGLSTSTKKMRTPHVESSTGAFVSDPAITGVINQNYIPVVGYL